MKTKRIITLTVSFLFVTYHIIAQGGYINDKNGKCKMYTPKHADTRTFTYTGDCTDGFISGFQTIQLFQDGTLNSTISGNFTKGTMDGPGTRSWVNGDVFEGEFLNSSFSKGTYKYADGKKYIGSFNVDGRNGNGIYYYEPGNSYSKYVGEFANDKMNGNGTLYHNSGNIAYIGTYSNGMKSGKGISYYSNGTKYEGLYKDNDEEDPKGVMTYTNGTKYEGGFAHGMKNGSGIVSFSSGEVYKGIFKDNDCDDGILYYKDGSSAKASFDGDYFVFTLDCVSLKAEKTVETTNTASPTTTTTSSINSSAKALEYLQLNFPVSTRLKSGDYWTSIVSMEYDDYDFLTINEPMKGKALEKYFKEMDETEIKKTAQLIDEDSWKINQIRWNKIRDIKITTDANNNTWLTIYAPVENDNGKEIGQNFTMYIWPDSKDKIKEAILYLSKYPSDVLKKEIEAREAKEQAEKDAKLNRVANDEKAKENHKQELRTEFGSASNAILYLKNNFYWGITNDQKQYVEINCTSGSIQLDFFDYDKPTGKRGNKIASKTLYYSSIVDVYYAGAYTYGCPSCMNAGFDGATRTGMGFVIKTNYSNFFPAAIGDGKTLILSFKVTYNEQFPKIERAFEYLLFLDK